MSIGKFDNTFIKLLRNQLKLGDDARILTGTDDPSSVAKDAERGSVYLRDTGSDGRLYIKNDDGSSTNWSQIAQTTLEGVEINFISNSGVELDLSGWVTYKDSANSVPDDGTGGTPLGVTLTRNTTVPIRGIADLQIDQAADPGGYIGEGVSYDFSVDNADLGTDIKLKFNFSTAGGYNTADIRIVMWDVIAGAPLASSSSDLLPALSGVGIYVNDYTVGVNKDLRLIIHNATVSTGVWTVNIDDVRVQPQTESDKSDSLPTGTLVPFAGTTLPLGYYFCDGQSYSVVTDTILHNAIGDAYGGDGGTNFNVPDLRGRFIRGTDDMGTGPGAAGNDPDAGSRAFSAAGGNINNNVGSIQTDEFKSHTHPEQGSSGVDQKGASGGSVSASAAITGATGGSETRPKNVYCNYLIKR